MSPAKKPGLDELLGGEARKPHWRRMNEIRIQANAALCLAEFRFILLDPWWPGGTTFA